MKQKRGWHGHFIGVHGHTRRTKGRILRSPIWFTWWSMLSRCAYPTSGLWKDYGAKGIRVCRRWRTFENFNKDMGPRPPGAFLIRLDTKADYRPGNCTWRIPRRKRSHT